MTRTMKNRKTLIIVIAAIMIAGIGFSAGMLAKESIASGNGDIGISKAKEIALASVGVSAEKAIFTKEVLDENAYEIDFYTSSNEYDFEIDADTGAIVERDVSPRDLTVPADSSSREAPAVNEDASQAPSSQDVSGDPGSAPVENDAAAQQSDDSVIGVAAAKDAALKHAGLTSASFQDAYLDYDDGVRVYDLEFTSGSRSYDYEINAYSGAIISYDIDNHDYDDYDDHDDDDDDHDDDHDD